MLTKKNLTLNKKTNKKINKKTNKSKTQKGSGFFADDKSYYFTNIRYNNSMTNFMLPILKCAVCNNLQFKMKVMKIDTQATAFITDGSFYGNRFNFFTCINCGNIHILSNNTSYTKTIDMPQTLQRKSNSKYKQKK